MFRFYAGKGGVGKTTCAAAAGLVLSRRGARTLVVSTDPAHSLGDALAVRLAAAPRKVRRSLFAAEMDADRALSRWLGAREVQLRTIASRGTYLDEEDIESLFRLSLPGVDELVGLVELRRLGRGFDEVVVDTAPTGHTLRLLSMPATLLRLSQVLDDLQAKHRALAHSLRGSVRRDAQDALIDELQEEARSLEALLRSEAAELHWVTLPEELSLAEARSGIAALRASGLRPQRLIVNRLTPAPDVRCAPCSARRAEETRVVGEAKALGLPISGIAQQGREPRGLKALEAVAKALSSPLRLAKAQRPSGVQTPKPERPIDVAEIAPSGVRLILFGGKGGVGKTTAAAAAALAIARSGRRVLVLSIDPAHSLGDALAVTVGDVEREVAPRVVARELDAARSFAERRQRYRAAVEELFSSLRGGGAFDAPYDRAVMDDLIDLAPPGLDELFALVAVNDALQRHEIVIVDTAPTGHALRLLQLVAKAREWIKTLLQIHLKYRRVTGLGDLARDLTEAARDLRSLEELLHDPARARFVVVTRAAALPRLETARLLAALRKLHIGAPSVLVNALTPKGCARCTRAAAREAKEVAALRRVPGGWAMLGAPLIAPAPRGAAALERFFRSWTRIG
jgi:arsenite-transporting ATPase